MLIVSSAHALGNSFLSRLCTPKVNMFFIFTSYHAFMNPTVTLFGQGTFNVKSRICFNWICATCFTSTNLFIPIDGGFRPLWAWFRMLFAFNSSCSAINIITIITFQFALLVVAYSFTIFNNF